MEMKKLEIYEKEHYFKWHEENAKSDLEDSYEILKLSNKWAIISGYYAMHNAAKYYISRTTGMKFSGGGEHEEIGKRLISLLGDKSKKDIIKRYIEEAKTIYEDLIVESGSDLGHLHKLGEEKRVKQSYYSKKYVNEDAKKFLDEIVKPFVELMFKIMI